MSCTSASDMLSSRAHCLSVAAASALVASGVAASSASSSRGVRWKRMYVSTGRGSTIASHSRPRHSGTTCNFSYYEETVTVITAIRHHVQHPEFTYEEVSVQ